MRKFLKKVFFFSLPFILLTVLVIKMDFFRIWGNQNYYTDNIVAVNREMVCTKTYNKHRDNEKFNSFIFGSSRSQAFKCKYWSKYLNQKAVPFHFDASGESLWGITKKIQYIDELDETISNALVILDRTLLRSVEPREGHLFISMPEVSKDSKIDYYFTYFKASINPKFLLSYTDYSIFKTHKSYMGDLIRESKYNHRLDKINCDLWYWKDDYIKKDSIGYYKTQIEKGIFYSRPKKSTSKCKVTDEEIRQLKNIKKIFNKHKTNYKIVISPVYDQIPLESEQLELLHEIFGKENVFNFSGKNKYTAPISNYYENSHYKPYLANEILEIIYKK